MGGGGVGGGLEGGLEGGWEARLVSSGSARRVLLTPPTHAAPPSPGLTPVPPWCRRRALLDPAVPGTAPGVREGR